MRGMRATKKLSKKCLKRLFWPVLTKFFEKRAPIFWSKIVQKVLKNAFLGLLFQNFDCGAEILPKQGLFSALGELEKSIWLI